MITGAQASELRMRFKNARLGAFIFMRHAHYEQRPECPSALQPWPLSPQGQQQASDSGRLLAEWCNKHSLHIHPAFFSSVSLRAWQTASLAAGAMSELMGKSGDGAPAIEQTEQLCERSVGALANLTTSEIEHALKADPRVEDPPVDWKSSPSYRLPVVGAESHVQAGLRVANWLIDLLHQPGFDPLQTPVVVGHGASFRHAAVWLGLLQEQDLARLSMHYAQPLLFARDSTDQSWTLVDGNWKMRDASKTNLD